MRQKTLLLTIVMLVMVLALTLGACNKDDEGGKEENGSSSYEQNITVVTEKPVYGEATKSKISSMVDNVNRDFDDDIISANIVLDTLQNGMVSENAASALCDVVTQYSAAIAAVTAKDEEDMTAADITVFKNAYGAMVAAVGEDAIGQLAHRLVTDKLKDDVDYEQAEINLFNSAKAAGPTYPSTRQMCSYYTYDSEYGYADSEYGYCDANTLYVIEHVYDHGTSIRYYDASALNHNIGQYNLNYTDLKQMYDALNTTLSAEKFIVMSRVAFSAATAVVNNTDSEDGAELAGAFGSAALSATELFSLVKDNAAVIKNINLGAEDWNVFLSSIRSVVADTKFTSGFSAGFFAKLASNFDGEFISLAFDVAYDLLNKSTEAEWAAINDTSNVHYVNSAESYYYKDTPITNEEMSKYYDRQMIALIRILSRVTEAQKTAIDAGLQKALTAQNQFVATADASKRPQLPDDLEVCEFSTVWSNVVALASMPLTGNHDGDAFNDAMSELMKSLNKYANKYAPYATVAILD